MKTNKNKVRVIIISIIILITVSCDSQYMELINDWGSRSVGTMNRGTLIVIMTFYFMLLSIFNSIR